ncbi:tail fiber domain-containing protein [Roseivirga sp. BDSF3-8]|uniref:tail fiber domain-containing protein n=1 Tax=Roseivirga sp. BDSF3-8 TaxID=3241598 RepID=UPI0035322A7F
MKNLLLLITLAGLSCISVRVLAQDPSTDRWVDNFNNTIINPPNVGSVGIETSFPLQGTKLDVRLGNIFQSPLSSSSTLDVPNQFIGIGDSFGQCDIYGIRVQEPLVIATINNPIAFANLGIKAPAANSINPIPVLSFYPSLIIEYDGDPDGCGTQVGRWTSSGLTVSGSVTANAFVTSSDERLKADFRELTDAAALIQAMHPVSYTLNPAAAPGKNLQEQRTMGFKAQELQAILPDVVHEGEDGFLGVNYDALIPVLVAALQEQQARIEQLEQRVAAGPELAPGGVPVPERIELFQNEPNPFDRETSIRLNLPQSVQNAVLYVYDMNGRQIKELSLEARGTVNARINAGELEAGMYIYALVADGKAIDSKRMILTR